MSQDRHFYYVTYMGVNARGAFTGCASWTMDRPISSIDDVDRFIAWLKGEEADLTQVVVLNWILLRTEPVEEPKEEPEQPEVGRSVADRDPSRCDFVNKHFRDNHSKEREDGWRCGREAGHANGHYLYDADGERVLDAMGPWVTL